MHQNLDLKPSQIETQSILSLSELAQMTDSIQPLFDPKEMNTNTLVEFGNFVFALENFLDRFEKVSSKGSIVEADKEELKKIYNFLRFMENQPWATDAFETFSHRIEEGVVYAKVRILLACPHVI